MSVVFTSYAIQCAWPGLCYHGTIILPQFQWAELQQWFGSSCVLFLEYNLKHLTNLVNYYFQYLSWPGTVYKAKVQVHVHVEVLLYFTLTCSNMIKYVYVGVLFVKLILLWFSHNLWYKSLLGWVLACCCVSLACSLTTFKFLTLFCIWSLPLSCQTSMTTTWHSSYTEMMKLYE